MKASKAPKKVYLHLTTGCRSLNGKYNEYKPAKIRIDDKIIEYVRTDTIIEMAEEYLYKQLNEGNMECGDMEAFIDGFKKYVKG